MVIGSVRIHVLSADMVCGISEGEGPWLLGWKPFVAQPCWRGVGRQRPGEEALEGQNVGT